MILLSASWFARGLSWIDITQTTWYYIRLGQTHFDSFWLSDINSNQTVVLFLGDSRAKTWPSPPGFSEWFFLNRGIGGDTSTKVLRRFDAHVKPLRPDIIIIQVCINDFFVPAPIKQPQKASIIANCETNIEQLVTQSTDLGAIVILTTIFPIDDPTEAQKRPSWFSDVVEAIDEVNAYLHTLAAPDVIIFDAHSILLSHNRLIQPQYAKDPLHLNALGYEALSRELVNVLHSLDGLNPTD